MKTIILFLMMTLFTVPGWAQKDLFANLTNKYADKDGFSASKITSDMFDLYLKRRNINEDSPVYEALKTLDNILVVSQNSFYKRGVMHPDSALQDEDVQQIHQDILKHYDNKNYTLFKTEKQMGEEVKVFLKKNRDKIELLALVTNSDRSTHLVELQGDDIDLSTVSDLNKALNLHGLENLYKINSNHSRRLYASAPPVPNVPSEEHIRKMVEKQQELIEKHRYLTEEQREKLKMQAREMAEKQREMAEKYREMALKYQRQPIFLSAPGDSVEYFINGKKVSAEEVKKISPDDIERVEVNKSKSEKGRGSIRITTRK
ncbi:MAG: DUF4252 domain-containing protein [Mariniphaga sp.]